jgi:hypothetical protein
VLNMAKGSLRFSVMTKFVMIKVLRSKEILCADQLLKNVGVDNSKLLRYVYQHCEFLL